MSHKNYRKEANCLNCGAEVKGHFCSNCGQENLETHENFFHMVGHFLSDYFHYDSKFFTSLKYLFTRPGFLTKEYWEGRRVRYIHPLRLYFFITLIFMIAATYFYDRMDKSVLNDLVRTTITYDHADSVAMAKDPGLQKKFEQEAVDLREKMQGNFNRGADRFIHQLNYISFFLLPVYAFVFRLLSLRRKRFYVYHLLPGHRGRRNCRDPWRHLS